MPRDDFCEFIFEKTDDNFYSDMLDIFENIGYFCKNPYYGRVLLWSCDDDDFIECKNKPELLALLADSDSAYLTLWNANKDDIDITAYIKQPYNYLWLDLGLFTNEESKKIINLIYNEIVKSSHKDILKHIVIDKTNYLAEKTFLLDDRFHLKLLENSDIYDLNCVDSHELKNGSDIIKNIDSNTVYILNFNRQKNTVTSNCFEWSLESEEQIGQ